MGKLAAVGWFLALLLGAAVAGQYAMYQQQKQDALAAQAAEYETKLQTVQAEAAAAVKKAQDEAAAQLQVMQTDLDFQKMPELPLKTAFRQGGVLYVENEGEDPFECKVRLFRPSNNQSVEVDFFIKARTFQDLGAIQNWVFAKYDKVEFVKPGFKPRSLTVP
jgi:hypothetical protein